LVPPDWNLLTFAFIAASVAGFTPGPNNTICMVSSASVGVFRTLPFAWGVTVGFPFMLAAVGFGLGGVLIAHPSLHLVIKIIGALFLLHLAWKIARARAPIKKTAPQLLGFWQAFFFQWINPKAIAIAFSLIATYTRPAPALFADITYLMFITTLVSISATLTWTLFGAGIGRLLKTAKALAIFNGVMGLLLALSIVPIFLL
jgi:threonine/homoserine/homoserine lactone efflux protein